MSYGVNSIQIHKKRRLDKRAGSDNWYARTTLPNNKLLLIPPRRIIPIILEYIRIAKILRFVCNA